jgi:hypothetical protein
MFCRPVLAPAPRNDVEVNTPPLIERFIPARPMMAEKCRRSKRKKRRQSVSVILGCRFC